MATSTAETPVTALRAEVMEARSWSGIDGSAVVMARWTMILESSTMTSRTRPKETMSLVKPGYLTEARAALMACSSIIDEIIWRRLGEDANRN